MSLVVTLKDFSTQVTQVEKANPVTQEEFEIALKNLETIPTKFHEVIKNCERDFKPGETILVQLTLNRIAALQDALLKKSPIGVSIDRIKEMMQIKQ